jgi:hypothetical protein
LILLRAGRQFAGAKRLAAFCRLPLEKAGFRTISS